MVTENHRFTRDVNGFEQLYHLTDDPDERTNLAVDGGAPQAHHQLMTAMVDALIQADDHTRTEPVAMEA